MWRASLRASRLFLEGEPPCEPSVLGWLGLYVEGEAPPEPWSFRWRASLRASRDFPILRTPTTKVEEPSRLFAFSELGKRTAAEACSPPFPKPQQPHLCHQ